MASRRQFTEWGGLQRIASSSVNQNLGYQFNQQSAQMGDFGPPVQLFQVRRRIGNDETQIRGSAGARPNLQREIMSKFNNTIQPQNLPNVGNMAASAGTQNIDSFDNRPVTATVIPKSWYNTSRYDEYFLTGDLLFVSDLDQVKDGHRQLPQRTVMNFQQLQKELFVKKAKAIDHVLGIMRNSGVSNPTKPSVDFEAIITEYRKKNMAMFENIEFNKDTRAAEILMENRYKDITDLLDSTATSVGVVKEEVDFLRSLGNEFTTAYESHKNTYVMKLQHYFIDKLIFLCPHLIPKRYKLLGAMHDQTISNEIKFNESTRQLQMTYVPRGPVLLRNVFGEPKSVRRQRQRKKNLSERIPDSPGYGLSKHNQLHISLVIDRNTYSYNGIQFQPTWAVPYCFPTKYEMIEYLEKAEPLVEKNYSYVRANPQQQYKLKTETKTISGRNVPIPVTTEYWTPRTQDTSWFVGKIVEFNVFKELNSDFYKMASGIKDYGKDGRMQGVYERREVAGFVKVNFATK